MSIVKASSAVMANPSSREKVGTGMVVAGLGGGALWFLAGLLPFVTFPMLLVAAVVAGFIL